jgi:hypothetical protein
MPVPAVPTDPMAEFQQKLRERVRNDIRELLPEEAIAALVQKAVNDEFFEKRMVRDGSGWNERQVQRPSLFVEAVIEAAKPIIAEEVRKFIAGRPETVEAVIVDFLDANKLAVATAQQLTGMLSSCVMSLQEALRR